MTYLYRLHVRLSARVITGRARVHHRAAFACVRWLLTRGETRMLTGRWW